MHTTCSNFSSSSAITPPITVDSLYRGMTTHDPGSLDPAIAPPGEDSLMPFILTERDTLAGFPTWLIDRKRAALNHPDDVRIVPSADVADTARIGAGSSIWHLAQVREDAVLGVNCVVGRGAYIGT